ncbi:retrovirus-related pol polyprotein from transposon RE1 [Citrus sinensis]|nr:retrovirus-related pol polyprotein from transposon RE1 [Citrus sinensis]
MSGIVGVENAQQIWSSLEDQLLPMTKEKEVHLMDRLATLKKGSLSVEEYVRKYKHICDCLAAINKPVNDLDKVFGLARGLGYRYQDFKLAQLSKPPYPSFKQFVMALENHEQTLINFEEEKKNTINLAQAFFSQRGRGNGGFFNSKGRGFTAAGGQNLADSTIECRRRYDYSHLTEEIPQALAAMNLDANDAKLYADSGETTHMVNDPGLKKNLLSVGQLTHDNSCIIEFSSNKFVVKDYQGNILAKGTKTKGLYALDEGHHAALYLSEGRKAPYNIWHQRMGHPQIKSIKFLNKNKLIDVSNWITKDYVCSSCIDIFVDLRIPKESETSNTHQMITRHKLRHHPELVDKMALTTTIEPKHFKTAIRQPHWRTAMLEELDALHQNNTWSLVPRPVNTNIVGSKWVYRTKFKEDGSIDKYKARLVAQGYTQIPGLDFEETFSPVIKPTTIQLIFSLAVTLNWTMRQLDVKNAFLHADSSLFIFHNNDSLILMLIYVDDIVVTGNNTFLIDQLIHQLSIEFALKDLGQLHFFLGLEIRYFSGGIYVSQTKYTKDLLTKAKMLESTSLSTPMAIKEQANPIDHKPVNATEYRRLVGGLQYLTLTRPDIVHAVNKVCQHFQTPTEANLRAVKRILRYLKGSLDYGIRFLQQSSLNITAFCDADWGGCPDTRRSTTGYCVYMGANCISWSSKRQPTVSRSSAEAEYRALASTAAELTWITYLYREIGIPLAQPPQLLSDNLSALHMTINPVFHARSKHIELDYHFIREKVADGALVTRFVPSSLQIADVFTKALSKAMFRDFRYKLGVHQMSLASLRGDVKQAD